MTPNVPGDENKKIVEPKNKFIVLKDIIYARDNH